MNKEILAADFKKITELAKKYFNRICPNVGGEEQQKRQVSFSESIWTKKHKEWQPRICMAIFDEAKVEEGKLFFANQKLSCSGLFHSQDLIDVKKVVLFGISIEIFLSP